jgi:glucosylceramidase
VSPATRLNQRAHRARRWIGLASLAVGLALAVALVLQLGGHGAARSPSRYDVQVVQTNSALTQRLTRLPDLTFSAAQPAARPVISVNAGIGYQRVRGFGAAMTDTSAWLIERRASGAARAALMAGLFGADGIRLGFVRIPIGASDFTRDGHPYSYDDVPAGRSDPGLRQFSVVHDRAYILPALRQALALNPHTRFLASPWSAPAWMKTNQSLGNIRDSGTLRRSAYAAWAGYMARFIGAYGRAGIPIGAITTQNEPTTGTSYPGMAFPATREASWTNRYLVPALARAGQHPLIFGGDLGWGPNSTGYANAVADSSAMRGLAWHCYFGSPGVMSRFHQAHPRLDEILDECSPGGPSPTPTSEIVIASLRQWASAVMLWNLALDRHGGPVEPPNRGCPVCIGLITIDQRTGSASPTRSYYQLGQASAFVAPGALRIASNHFVSYRYPQVRGSVVTPGLDDVAFRNPDGSLVLIAYNGAATTSAFAVRWRGRSFSYTLAPGAMVTFRWNRG